MADEPLQSDLADRVVEDRTLDLSLGAKTKADGQLVAIGRYQIIGVLGEGGFGRVYLGFDESLQREVAIKVPHPQRVATPGDVNAYLTEARTVANLDHPHILPVFDVGSTAQFPCFIVSKYIDGTDLAARLKRSRLSVFESVELLATVADALHHAHKQGLVHRDVKPGNILLDKNGKPFVADFGLALREQDAPQGPSYAGTPAYMSPEQARGEGHRVDARSDIFSLGVVLYELLAGRKPFRARSDAELRNQIVTCEPRPPRQYDERVPKELDRICLKALSKRVAERYSTASDMAEDLRHFLAKRGDDRQLTMVHDGRALRADADVSRLPSPPPEVTPADTPASHPTDSRPLRIVPKGLRSFDAHDADFFLELLPGPRDRDGLPDSIRFWKTRVEEKDSDDTFTVGLIYGPSGCGKSSLAKAGLLTRLPNDVITVYVEATAAGTETRLLYGLRKRCPWLPDDLNLAKTTAALRRGAGPGANKKVLVVLDQFEQWLHANSDAQGGELVSALRQCDGVHLQCVVMVRDDFWLALSRFMGALEIELTQGKNMALVDLFDRRHAKKVLASFGRAFGSLSASGELSGDEELFLDRAVSGLAQSDKIIPVRLAVFAEMVKHRPWTPATLDEVGGMEGVGVTFLDETFAAASSAPQYRAHRKAAQAVLKALVPDSGTDIKGKMRSEQELLVESGYAAAPDNFAALMRILDGELRLVTPTDPEEETAVSKPSQKYYQLAHDYLVHSLRDWLTRTQRATRRGRAQLLLDECAAAFSPKRDVRFLPGWLEWPSILLFTKHRAWTAPQRRLMRAANKHYVSRLAVLTLAASLAAFAGLEAHRRIETRRAQILAESVFSAPPDAVRYTLDNLLEVGRRAVPVVRERFQDAQADPLRKLRAAYALSELGAAPLEFLLDAVATAPAGECGNLVAALRHVKDAALPQLLRRGASTEDRTAKARYAIVALQLGETEPARRALAVRGDPSDRTALIHGFANWHGDVADLMGLLAATADPAFRSGLCAALGTIQPPRSQREAAVKTLTELYMNAPGGGTHSAAGWALRQWGEKPPALATHTRPISARDWFVNRHGLTMVKIPSGTFSTMDRGQAMGGSFSMLAPTAGTVATCGVRLTKPFYVCDREVWIDLFREFIQESSVDESPLEWKSNYLKQTDRGGDVPVQLVNWDDAVRFCNWLSRQERRRPCYRRLARGASDHEAAPSLASWQWDREADGYRLPTEAEWEHVCRAGAATAFCFGDDPKLLGQYAVYVVDAEGAPRPGRQKLPNAWGLFDVHGNVAEWCYDWFAPYPAAAIDPIGPVDGTERVYRGGSFFEQYAGACAAQLRGKVNPDLRSPPIGFRVVVSEVADD